MVAVLERILGRPVGGSRATTVPGVLRVEHASAPRVGDFHVDYSELALEEIEADVPGMDALLRNSVEVSSNRGL